MNAVDLLLLALIAAAVVWAVARCVRNARRGGCSCGGCAGCSRCQAAAPEEKMGTDGENTP